MISIFSDRLEIQNPGFLPFGMTLDNFKAGTSMVRNRTIAKVLRQLSLMEEWGSGYHRVTTACNEHDYPIPKWFEIGHVLRVIFTPHPLTKAAQAQFAEENVPVNVPGNVPVNKRQQWFFNQLEQGLQCKLADIAAQWNEKLQLFPHVIQWNENIPIANKAEAVCVCHHRRKVDPPTTGNLTHLAAIYS